jgi:peptidoglycan/LPS O-acetylase OafA/YrhL
MDQRAEGTVTSGELLLRPAYRAEIDGLRAVAVVPVVLYHAGIRLFPGGFVGVDVFFVISGYLITSILALELAAGRYSIIGFYTRRARRLLPALAGLLLFCSVAATLLFMPYDLKEFGQSVVAASLSLSNVYFWLKVGYFDPLATLKPLLHTWSLAVEDQYYLVFPVFMLIAARLMKRRWPWAIAVVLLLSLAVAAVEAYRVPPSAFYLLPSRMWELLLGSLLAVRPLPVGSRRLREGLAALGLVLIFAAVFCYTADTVFPGLAALPPCLGAALVIQYGPETRTAKLLSLRPLVWIGLISYSLYLYHWPLIVFAKYLLIPNEAAFGVFALPVCLLSVGAAYLSYRYIETPFRRGGALRSRRKLFQTAALAMGCFVAFGLAANVTVGFPHRLAAPTRTIALGAIDTTLGHARCDLTSAADIAAGRICHVGDPGGAPSFAVFGDSFAEALMPALDAAARQQGAPGVGLTRGGCYPLVGTVSLSDPPADAAACTAFNAAVVRYINETPSIRRIILIARWTSAAEGTRYGADASKGWFIADRDSTRSGYDENRAVFARAIARTARAFPGRSVYFVAYIPEQPFNVPQAEALCRYLGKPCPGGVPRADFDRRQAYVRQVLSTDAERLHYGVIDLGAALCSATDCPALSGGTALYSDDNHLSRTGAMSVEAALDPIFSPQSLAGDAGR